MRSGHMNEHLFWDRWRAIDHGGLFAILAKSKEERRYFRVMLVEKVRAIDAQAHIDVLEAHRFDTLFSKINHAGLFQTPQCLILEEAQCCSEDFLNRLMDCAVQLKNEPHLRVVLSFADFAKSTLCKKVLGQACSFDLLAEKPWERDERWRQSLMERARSHSTTITPKALGLLIKRCGDSRLLAEQELDRLTIFCGSGTSIDERCVAQMVDAQPQERIWPFIRAVENLDWSSAWPIVADLSSSGTYALATFALLRTHFQGLLAVESEEVVVTKPQVKWTEKRQQLQRQSAKRLGRSRILLFLRVLNQLEGQQRMGEIKQESLLSSWFLRCATSASFASTKL